MANKRIDQLNPNLENLNGSELIPIFDTSTSTTERITVNTLSNFININDSYFITGATFDDYSGLLSLERKGGELINLTINRYSKNYIPLGETFTVSNGCQNFIYGDIIIDGVLNLEENGELVVLNGDIIISGGTIIGSGNTYSITLPEFNTFVTDGQFNPTTKQISFTGNFGFTPFDVDLSSLSTDNFYTTGGTYNSLTESIDFSGNSSATTFSVNVSQLLDDTNTFTTGATLNNSIIEFNRNDLSNAYSVDLSPLKFTGNTSADCITDLYVTNLNSCSPLHIQPTNNGDVYISESGGFVGIGTNNPITTLDVNGDVNISNSLSATTFYGDGSNLVGVSSDNFYTTGGTYNSLTESIDFSGNSSATTYSVDLTGLNITGNVILNESTLTTFNGNILKTGTGTTVQGNVYYLNSSNGWSLTNANSIVSSDGLLGIAVGSDPSVDGMLINGLAKNILYTGTTGSPLYLSTTNGVITEYPPSGPGFIIRIIGYKLGTSGSILFNPDPTWIEL
jgi:hypothetical protein